MKRFLKKQGFTLVELIIVIAIISVLALSAFLILTKWLGSSRDARRLSDLGTIKKALDVHYIDPEQGDTTYPDPTNSIDVLDGDGITMWNLGVFGSGTTYNMDNLQSTPTDPGDKKYYKYANTLDGKEYQVGAILENGDSVSLKLSSSVFAQNTYGRIEGQYDGYVGYGSGSGDSRINRIFETPSILFLTGNHVSIPINSTGSIDNLLIDQNSPLYNDETVGLISFLSSDRNSLIRSKVLTTFGISDSDEITNIVNSNASNILEKEETSGYTEDLSDGYFVLDSNNDWDGDGTVEGCAESGLTDSDEKCIIKLSSGIYVAPKNSIQIKRHEEDDGYCSDSIFTDEACGYCESLNIGGKDWYLPPVGTGGLEDLSNNMDILNISTSHIYWTSSLRGRSSSRGWAERKWNTSSGRYRNSGNRRGHSYSATNLSSFDANASERGDENNYVICVSN